MTPIVTTPVPTRIAFHDGEFVEAGAVRLGPGTQALNYGTGVFEGIRAYTQTDGTSSVFRLTEHLERLRRSAAALRIQLPYDVDQLREIVLELLARNESGRDIYIRPLAYKLALEPGTPFGVRLRGVSAQLSIIVVPMGSYVSANGLHCKISSFVRVSAAAIPSHAKITGTYVNNALAVEEAQADGCDEAILLDATGHLTEASTSNIFVVLADGTIASPPATADLLPGITRATVIELLARELGVTIAERPVHATELSGAREVFLTGTGVEVIGVTAIDHRPVGTGGIGAVTARIGEIYTEVVRGLRPAHQTWLTPVPPESRPDLSTFLT